MRAKGISSTTYSFTGYFTPDVRKKLSHKIDSLDVPRHCVARFFNINWTTLRKWENGQTAKCRTSQIDTINAFLNGKYDKSIVKSAYAFSAEKYIFHKENCINAFFHKIINAYSMCTEYNCEEKFRTSIEAEINTILCSIIPELISSKIEINDIISILNLDDGK